jgi:MSHA biogenesis protein MshN
MSLINQVLKDLDKRGASTNIGEATIRVVHLHRRRNVIWLVTAGAAALLLLLGIAWQVWQGKAQHQAPPAAIVVVQPVELKAAQPIVASIQVIPPSIDTVIPEAIITRGVAQMITIIGRNFKPGASVNLREEGGQLYANRAIVKFSPGQLILNLNFGKATKAWTLEVVNTDGAVSGQYLFTVRAATMNPATDKSADTHRHVASARASEFIVTNQPGAELPGAELKDGISKQPTRLSPKQQADNEYRRAYQLMRQGRNTEALAGYEGALLLDARHDQARQAMVSLLLEKKRNADAERVLQEGLAINPQQTDFAMLLARLQADRNALPIALDTMLKTLPYAEKQPEYLAIVAALMQRQNNHQEAIDYYRKALQLKPQAGVWLMGLGISLRASQQNIEAREAFKRALDSNTLSTELQAYVSQQLKEL